MTKSEKVLGDTFAIGSIDHARNSLAMTCFRKKKEDIPEIEEFLNDLGKYEKIVNGIGYIVKSLGLNNNEIDFYEITKDDITYEGVYDKMESCPVFYVRIDEEKYPEERREFTEDQLRNLIKNLDKYSTLKESLGLLKVLLEK